MQTLELSATDAVSIASLINAANSGTDAKITPALNQVRIRIKDGTVTAMASDRFTLATYTAAAMNWNDGDGELGLTPAACKFIAANVKRISKHYSPESVEITWDESTREFSIRHGGAVYGDTYHASKYPDVESLIDGWQPAAAAGPVVLRGEFLARLNKFIDAFSKVQFWTLELGMDRIQRADRPGPVMARYHGFKVLIQPNLIKQD